MYVIILMQRKHLRRNLNIIFSIYIFNLQNSRTMSNVYILNVNISINNILQSVENLSF